MAKNRISGGSFLSDDEFVVIRLGSSGASETRLQPPRAASISQEVAEPATQIRRITMKNDAKQEAASVRKKDSVASIIIDTKESLKMPLIVQTQSVDSATSETEDMSKLKTSLLNKTDLPRSLRSTRRLSACNDKVLMELQQRMLLNSGGSIEHCVLNMSRRSSRRSSSLLMENAKAASFDGNFPGGRNSISSVGGGLVNDSGKAPKSAKAAGGPLPSGSAQKVVKVSSVT